MLDLSLNRLASEVGVKRMLVHYFVGREAIEERALILLKGRLRAQFAPENTPAGISAGTVLDALWNKRDLSRRAWNGSVRAKSFYREHKDCGFQGEILAYLITGDPEPGRLMLHRFCARLEIRRKSKTTAMHSTARSEC